MPPPTSMPWRPIQTAPTDGSDVLGIRAENGRQLVVRWDAAVQQWTAMDTVVVAPSHWQPLPPFPDPPGQTPLPAPEERDRRG